MGFRSRSRGSRLGTPNRRQSSWQVGPGGTTSVTVATSTTTILGSVANATEDGLTVVRIRGELLVMLLTSNAAGNGFSGAFGIGVASADATAVGVTAVPNPIDDEDWDGWMYHRYFHLRSATALVAADAAKQVDGGNACQACLRLEVDSKAMRKLPENMGLFASIQVVISGVASMSHDFNSRILIKLP